MRFYLGTHKAAWLARTDAPLFVSRRTLAGRRKLPRARGRWALDSGGFTELQIHGMWMLLAWMYVEMVRRYRDEIGGLDWAAPQDWMCEQQVIAGLVVARGKRYCTECKAPMRTAAIDVDERPLLVCDGCGRQWTGAKPAINVARWRTWAATAGPVMAPALAESERLGIDGVVVFHGTGLSVEEHQRRTIDNFLELTALAPDLPWIPVLQGGSLSDYLRHLDDYAARGVDLRRMPVVGLGSICRRQGTDEAAEIVARLASLGLRLHGFGLKLAGLRRCRSMLVSADSMAWSYDARAEARQGVNTMPDHAHGRTGKGSHANCLLYGLRWRDRIDGGQQQFDFTRAA